jgi:preprotein translocase subunit SecF
VFDVIGKRNWFFLFSGLILIPGIFCILLTPITNGSKGLQFSVDYTEGTKWIVQFQNKDVTVSDVHQVLADNGMGDAQVSEDAQHYFTIRTKRTDLMPVQTPPPYTTPTPAPSGSVQASATPTASPAPSATPTASPSATPTASPAPSATGSTSPLPSGSVSPGPTATPTPSPTPSASASPTVSPSPTPAPNLIDSVDQDGKPCKIQLAPPESMIEKLTNAFKADSKIGPLSCTAEQSTVGPAVSSELIQQTVLLIVVGSFCILAWIALRFRGFKYGAAAVVALVHDVFVVVGIFAILGTLFGVQIDGLFVTAMLTVIGFSVHDTIVVFDRIRENRARHAGEPFDQIVNHSILQTFGRSINTSFTVVLTLTALLLFAGASIKYFVLALLIGIIAGTYSSIFNASPLLVVWQGWEDRRKAARIANIRPGKRARA